MGFGKGGTQKLPFEENKEYNWFTPPDTEDVKAYRGWNPEADPSRPYQFARQRSDILNLYNNPLGAYTTPELREQMTRSALQENAQEEGQSALAENAQLNNLKGAKYSDLARLTSPQLQNTRSSGYRSQAKEGGLGSFLGYLAGNAATAASAFV